MQCADRSRYDEHKSRRWYRRQSLSFHEVVKGVAIGDVNGGTAFPFDHRNFEFELAPASRPRQQPRAKGVFNECAQRLSIGGCTLFGCAQQLIVELYCSLHMG